MLSDLRHLLLALLLAVLAVVPARAEVSGFVAWNWAEFSRDSNKRGEDVDASHFLQTYSLLYEKQGQINHGRAGEWRVALGYQWTSLDSSVNDIDNSIDSGKLLYSGELTFAPGGLPLRVHAYSRDMNTTAPGIYGQGQLLTPRIYGDLYDSGENRVSGVTLLAGIKNGSYLGQYREVLSTLPKLLLDYRETYIRDLDKLNPEHSRLRDLAFVSLNKKDNWFHYRVAEYTDYLEPENNFETRAYILGTIDHQLKREWINLTNWIQVSVDGSLEQFQQESDVDEDDYLLNLFVKAQRRDWRLTNLNSYARSLEETGALEKRLDLPVFASGELDPRNKWYLGLIHTSEEDLSVDGQMSNEHLSYLSYKIESQRQSGWLVSPDLAIDVKRATDDAEGQAIRAGVELRTDSRRDLPTSWLADYHVSWFNDKNDGSNYLEQSVVFGVNHHASSRVRVGANQRLSLGTGTYVNSTTEYLKPVLSSQVNTANFSDVNIDGTSWRSQTALYLELLQSASWTHRFSADFDYMDRGGETTEHLRLEHVANYRSSTVRLDISNQFERGDGVSVQTDPSALGIPNGSRDAMEYTFTHGTEVEFAPSQRWKTSGKADLTWVKGREGSYGLLQLEQRAGYGFYSSQGLRRKLLALEQEFRYESLFGDVEGSPWYAELQLASTWYLSTYLTLGARGEFRHYGETGANVFEYGLTAQVPFDKFQVAVTYEYGQADDGWEYLQKPGVKEQRWEVDIRKTF